MMFFRFDIGARARSASRLIGNIRNDLIEAVVKERTAKGLSQQQLAELAGMSRSALNKSLSGREELTLRSIAELAWALNREVHVELREPGAPAGQNFFAETSTLASGPKRSAGGENVQGTSSSGTVRTFVARPMPNGENEPR